MRIVDWAELKTLPQGTITQMLEQGGASLGPPMVFGGAHDKLPGHEDMADDFTEAALLPESNSASVLGRTRPDDVPEHSWIIYQPTGHGRYAGYDLEEGHHRWLVWEQADRERMARWLLNPEQCADEQNSDDYTIVTVELAP